MACFGQPRLRNHNYNAAIKRKLRPLAQERQHLQCLPSPYRGRSVRELPGSARRKPVMAYQHLLSIYEDLFA